MGDIYMGDVIEDPTNNHQINQRYMVIVDSNGKNLVFVHTDRLAAGLEVEFERVTGEDNRDDFAVNVRPKSYTGVADGLFLDDRILDPIPSGRSGLDLGYFQLKDESGEVLPYLGHEPISEGTSVTFNRIKGNQLFGKKDSAINVKPA